MDRIVKYLVVGFIFVGLCLTSGERCQGYIMPAEQLIALMAKSFSKFQTLVIVQSTQQMDERYEGGEESFMERLWMKSPNLFRSEVLDHPMGRAVEPDVTYRQLFVTNSGQRLSELLSRVGVNLHSVALAKVDGIIAYRIGDKEPERPKIIIEKDRFLPLLFVYRSPEQSVPETITVHFKDYKMMDEGWYPFEITYFDGKALQEIYTIHTLQANAPIDSALFAAPKREYAPDRFTDPRQMAPEEERLRKIIEKFEQKYR